MLNVKKENTQNTLLKENTVNLVKLNVKLVLESTPVKLVSLLTSYKELSAKNNVTSDGYQIQMESVLNVLTLFTVRDVNGITQMSA